ncbi:hypothetical protein EJ06DRAFT_579026 [Trichodelitschia bisporula]|uniref:D-lactate dehydratase n=1 Tax=Trichodelitschia bisporula TaxID=703511 RepID=A0A6G1I8E0_9PEZI|nr:hypothetical protein EJ06DRAFT_579026 [Trichodelitschia bisporula]
MPLIHNPSTLILFANGTEEIALLTCYDVLVRAGFAVRAAEPDADILILTGGAAGAKTLTSATEVLSLIRAYRDSGRWVGAIGTGTTTLVASCPGEAGKTEGLESARKARVTSHPSVKAAVVNAGWKYA